LTNKMALPVDHVALCTDPAVAPEQSPAGMCDEQCGEKCHVLKHIQECNFATKCGDCGEPVGNVGVVSENSSAFSDPARRVTICDTCAFSNERAQAIAIDGADDSDSEIFFEENQMGLTSDQFRSIATRLGIELPAGVAADASADASGDDEVPPDHQ
jgi:hypothetical protein